VRSPPYSVLTYFSHQGQTHRIPPQIKTQKRAAPIRGREVSGEPSDSKLQ
jgi:hypothetical protein